MARTIIEIQTEIIAAKNADSELSGLTSTSQTAIWRLWTYIVAVSHFVLESLWDIFKVEIETLVASRRLGTPSWYIETSFDFQIDDSLNEDGSYAIIDEAKKIITRASFKENDIESVLVLKVAKGTITAPTALSPTELTQFRSYINKLKFAGTKISIVSLNADLLRGNIKIYYDGIFNPNVITTDIQDAIKAYLFELPFDGVLITNELIERIRNVAGVLDCEIVNLRGVQGVVEYPIARTYETQAGYIQLDELNLLLNLIIE